jgi:Cft2 family RNA processing exonuclease
VLDRILWERLFLNIAIVVYDTVTQGGRCLIPVFALGRAQELLLILDEFWEQHPELHVTKNTYDL